MLPPLVPNRKRWAYHWQTFTPPSAPLRRRSVAYNRTAALRLHALGGHTYLLDGDNVRHGLNRDLGFTPEDRVENIRRIAEVARLMVDAGLTVLVSAISPFRTERAMARGRFDEGDFYEIFVDTALEVCEARDSKGLYKAAREGRVKNFTGIDSPYEQPEAAELILNGGGVAPDELATQVIAILRRDGVIGEP